MGLRSGFADCINACGAVLAAQSAKCFTKPNPKERAACAAIAAVNYAWCTGLCIGAEGVCYLEEAFRPSRGPRSPSVNRAAHQALNEALRYAK